MKLGRNRRYSGKDRHFGPFTLSEHNEGRYQPYGMTLDSGGENDYGHKGCNLKIQGFGYTFIVELPNFLPDFRIKHIAKSWDAATVARMGRDYYYEVFPREYGLTFSDGALHLHFGPQTHDSLTTKSKCYFLPWKSWRHIRKSMYGLNGEHYWTETKGDGFNAWYEAKENVPKVLFKIRDYDGSEVEAKTHIEEWEWRFGEGWFKWLSLFRRPRIKRTLEINFSTEIGPEKGSWKGGLMGTRIDMFAGELHESAFRRYCEQEHQAKYGRFRIEYVSDVSGQNRGG